MTHTHTHTHLRARSSPTLEHVHALNWNFGTAFGTQHDSGHAQCQRGVAEKVPLVSHCEAMPKAGPSPLEWKRRLEAFARGEYAFSTGQKPRKGSRWHKVLCAIEGCPRQGKPASAKDTFGKPLVCKCGYHKISTKVSKTCR